MNQLLAALLLLAISAPCQLLVVDPAGNGNFTDLQTAINAAPGGATLHVVGGSYGPITITRSLTIVGQPAPIITQPLAGNGSQPPAISLQGAGSDTLILANVRVANQADGFWWNACGAALAGSGFAHLRICDSVLRGALWINPVGLGHGASGIEVSNAAVIVTERCSIMASASITGGNDGWAPTGAAAIAASGATVIALDSVITGGDAGGSSFTTASPWPTNCPCPTAGTGGPGIAANSVYHAAGIVNGGSGSVVTWLGQPWGQQADGPAFATNTQVAIPATMIQTTPLRLGSTSTVAFANPSNPALLVIGFARLPPATYGAVSTLFIDPNLPLSASFLGPATLTSSLTVPTNAALIGIEIVRQRFDLAATGITASNPIFAVVLP